MADEKFSIPNVTLKMDTIKDHFAAFSDTLASINSYVETNVNVGTSSAVFGDLGTKLMNIWNYNSATFNDFHENFETWAQVVSVISANNSKFAVDAQATYRDNVGTLDGVQEAREFVSKSNGLANVATTEGFKHLSTDARSVLDSAYRALTEKTEKNNTYGGKTITYKDAEGNTINLYYDNEGNYVGKKVKDKSGNSTCYNKKGVKIDKMPTKSEYEAEREARKEELEKLDSYYMNHIDDLKYGTWELRSYKTKSGKVIEYYIYVPDYGRDVTGLPTMLYMHGGSAHGTSKEGWTKYGLTSFLNNKDVTPSGIVICPFIRNFEGDNMENELVELTDAVVAEYNGDTNKISVAGHSYGGITAYRMVNANPDHFSAVIPISGSAKVTDSFKGVKVWSFNGTGEHRTNSGTSMEAGKNAVNAVNSVGGEATMTEIQGGHSTTNRDTFSHEYESPDGIVENPMEWAFRQTKASSDSKKKS